MKKQAVIFTLLMTCTLFSFNTNAQQTVLLDANGVPLSDEALLFLSSGTKNFTENDQIPKTETKKKIKEPEFKAKKIPNRRSDPLLEEELLDAMKAGKIPRVKQLLRAGIAPTFKNYKGETPIGIAVSRGWASMVISLLENGADINEKGARGVTLLHVASAKGLTDVAKVLVRGGLSPSQKTDKNWTPLHVAARYNHWKLVQYYVAEGVDPDIRNSDGQTALGLARHLRHLSIIKILSPVTSRGSLSFAEMNLLKKKAKRKSKKRKKRKKRRS